MLFDNAECGPGPLLPHAGPPIPCGHLYSASYDNHVAASSPAASNTSRPPLQNCHALHQQRIMSHRLLSAHLLDLAAQGRTCCTRPCGKQGHAAGKLTRSTWRKRPMRRPPVAMAQRSPADAYMVGWLNVQLPPPPNTRSTTGNVAQEGGAARFPSTMLFKPQWQTCLAGGMHTHPSMNTGETAWGWGIFTPGACSWEP